MRAGLRVLTVSALFSMAVSGCSCDGGSQAEADPFPATSVETLDFAGLCAGGALRETLEIHNKGQARLNAEISFAGRDAASFTAELDGEPVTVVGVNPAQFVTIEVVFQPTGGTGGQEAELVLDTNSVKQKSLSVLLTGFFSENPEGPRLSMNWETCFPLDDPPTCPDVPKTPCCKEAPTTIHMGQVGVESKGIASLQLENSGCGPAEIVRIEVGKDRGDLPCGDDEVRFDLPDDGLELPGSVTSSTGSLEVVFEPTGKCVLDREIAVYTQGDPNPTIFRMEGEATAGNLLANPNPVEFGTVKKGNHADRSVRLIYLGNNFVEVTEFGIDGKTSEHFKVLRAQQCGTEVTPPAFVYSQFEKENENGEPLQDCEKELSLDVRYEPLSPGLHGAQPNPVRIRLTEGDGNTSFVNLHGQSQAKMKTYPTTRIAFASPVLTGCGQGHDCGACINSNFCTSDANCGIGMRCLSSICTSAGTPIGSGAEPQGVCTTSCGTAKREFAICNEGGSNDLEITSLTITSEDGTPGGPVDAFPSVNQGRPLFSVDPGTCTKLVGMEECCVGTVDFLDGYGGGVSHAILNVETSVGSHPINLFRSTEVVLRPTSGAFGIAPEFPRTSGPVRIRANVDARHGTVTRYDWYITANSGASQIPVDHDRPIDPAEPDANCGKARCFELQNDDGEACMSDGSDCTTLVMYPDVAGQYEFRLRSFGSVCDPMLDDWKDGSVEVM